MGIQKIKKHGWYVILLALSACSSTAVVEEKVALPVIPEYVKIPHPAGFDLADLRAIFVGPLAPKDALGEFAETCDEEFKKLMTATPNTEERKKGAIELVTQDPERMHWCFYTKISKLQEVLQGDSTWTFRQKKVIESFEFLSPIANSFVDVYHDTRYLRWATQYYSKVSEWVFFRRMEPTAENTLLLTSKSRQDLESWISVQKEESKERSVFSKYGITLIPTVAGGMSPLEAQERAPASEEPKILMDESAEKPPVAPAPELPSN